MHKLIYILCALFLGATPVFGATTTEPASVGKAAQEGANSGKNTRWVQYTIAGVAVAGAITAIVLISKKHGGGHHSQQTPQ